MAHSIRDESCNTQATVCGREEAAGVPTAPSKREAAPVPMGGQDEGLSILNLSLTKFDMPSLGGAPSGVSLKLTLA